MTIMQGLCTEILVAQQKLPIDASVLSGCANRLQAPLIPRFWGSTHQQSQTASRKPQKGDNEYQESSTRTFIKEVEVA